MPADAGDALTKPLILFVEDELLIREMVVEALEEGGFSTVVASDAPAALALLQQHANEIVGLISDINLNGEMDGWQLACAAREQDSNLPVVYVSGASGHEWAFRGVPQSLMITKPFAPAQIVVAISSLLVTDVTR